MGPRSASALLIGVAFATLAILGAPTISHAVTVVRGPYLQCGTTSSVIVRWRTDVAASTRLVWGAEPTALNASAFDPSVTTEHSATMTGLQPGTSYSYAIGAVDSTYAVDASYRYV